MTRNRHIFLSYRNTELEFALRLAADLKNAGVNLWVDRLDIKPGDDWLKTLQDAVNDCAAMICVLSPEYVTSKYCQRELARADRMGRPIFPVLLRSVEATDWPFEIERQQYIDFREWRSEENYREQLAQLVDILKDQLATQIRLIPDAETRYLTSLIAELEARKGVMEYVDLPTHADRLAHDDSMRPRPRFAEAWTMYGAFAIVDEAPDAQASDAQLPPQPKQPLSGIDEAVEKFPRFVLTGAPGAGKTTTLRHLVLEAARARQASPRSAPLPLFLKLTAWRDEPDPAEFIRANWQFDSDPIKLLQKGKVKLYLDGLNEMDSFGAIKAAMLRDWLHGEQSPQYAILTCRTADYHDDLYMGLPVVEATEMDKPRVEQFVVNYLGEDEAPPLLARLLPEGDGDEPPSLYHLTRNPYLLSALILVHRSAPDADFPRNTGALLRRLAADLWERERLRNSYRRVTFEEVEGALTRLAFAMTDMDMPVYVPWDFALQYGGAEAALRAGHSASYLEIENDHIRFSHHLLQDYFAALGLAQEGLPTRLMYPQFDENGRRRPTKWDAVIVALAGAALDPDVVVRNVAEVDPYLALDCIAGGAAVTDSTRQRTLDQLLHIMRAGDRDSRMAAAHALAVARHEAAIPFLLDTLRDEAWDVRLAANAVLRDLDQPLLPGLEQALQNWESDIRDATAAALWQLGDTAIPTLLRHLDDRSWEIRRGAAWALGTLKDKAAVPGLVQALHDDDQRVGAEAAIALGWIRDDSAIPWLLEALRHPHWRVRKAAAGALGWIGLPALPGLLAALHDDSEDVRRLAIEPLKSIQDAAVLPALLEATYDASAEVRAAAVEALVNTEDAKAVKRLIELLSDNARARWHKLRISEIAARILEAIGTSDAVAAVTRWRQGDSQKTPETPAQAGAKRGRKSAPRGKERLRHITGDHRPAVAEAANGSHSQDWIQRRHAVQALANVDAATAVAELTKALRDEAEQVRVSAVSVLATIKNDAAIQILFQALGDDDYMVADAALEALKSVGARVVPGALKALRSKNINVRGAAIELLGHLRDVSAVPDLIECLSDTGKPWLAEERICDLAVQALDAIGTPNALKAAQEWRIANGLPTTAPEAQPEPTAAISAEAVEAPPAAPELDMPAAPINGEGGQRQREILTELLDALRQEDWNERQDAARALREYARTLRGSGDPVTVQRLSDAMQDEDWVVRWAAAEALAWIGDSSAVPVLLQRLGDENWMVRVAVVRALAEIGDPMAVGSVMNALLDRNHVVREAAAEALGVLGDTHAIHALTKALVDEERFVRLAAVEALSRLNDSLVVPHLVRMLRDEDNDVRWTAAEALGRLGDAQAVMPLIECLDDTDGPHWEDKRVCDVVAEALDLIGTAEAKAAVEEWRQRQAQAS